MQKQSPFKKWMGLISLGYMGGMIYVPLYLRYVFYDQLMQTMQVNNAQLAMLNTVNAVVAFIVSIPGAYLADKLDAKKVIVFSISGIAIITFIFAAFTSSYTMACILWAAQAIVMASYWACLIKYINNLGSEDEAGNSFGMYYMINGLSGALGNAAPLWFANHFGGMRPAILAIGAMLALAAVLVFFFLDNEKKLAERGVYLKGDDPIQLKHIPYVLKWPPTYIIFLAYFTTYTIYSNVSYFNPYLIDVLGVDASASSALSVVRSYVAMLLAPVGGFMADKVFKSTSKWYIVAFSIAGVLFALVFLFGPNSNQTIVLIYSVLPSLIVMPLYSVTYSIMRELHTPAIVSGTVIGLGSLSGTLVDGGVPLLFGSLIDKFGNTGYTYIFILLILDCVAGILVALWARSHDRKCRSGQRSMNLEGIQ